MARPSFWPSPAATRDKAGSMRAGKLPRHRTTGRSAPFRPEVSFQGKQGRIVLEQMHCFDQKRLIKRLGRIDQPMLDQTLQTLQILFK